LKFAAGQKGDCSPVEDDLLPANPALRIGRHLRQRAEVRTETEPSPSPKPRASWPRHATTSRAVSVDLCGLRTGLRLGELLALQWGSIALHGGFIVVERNFVRGVMTSSEARQRRRLDMSAELSTALSCSDGINRPEAVKLRSPQRRATWPRRERDP
jgi:integrase